MLHDQGKLDEAEPLMRQTYEAMRATLGDRHPDTLGLMINLVLLLKDKGKIGEALELERLRARMGAVRTPATAAGGSTSAAGGSSSNGGAAPAVGAASAAGSC